MEVFNYNFFVWCSSFFFLGLQFTHFDAGPMAHLTFDPATMATWGPGMWLLAIVLIGLIALILADVMYHYYLLGIVKYYAAYGIALFVALKWQSARVKPEGRAIHIHHYCIGFVVMSFLSFQGKFFTLIHGFFNGMFLEGGCRWGFDMIWPYNEGPTVSDDQLMDTQSHTPAMRRAWVLTRAK